MKQKRIMIITQKVNINDNNLGFFHEWISEFAKYVKILVVCLERGEFDLPQDVKVFSLGKELGRSKIMYLYKFYNYIIREIKSYDSVFVHMNPIYVILGWPIWRIYNKRITLWYTHKKVDWKLRLAVIFCDVVFSASRESFRLNTNKVVTTGHGISLKQFNLVAPRSNHFNIISVGRISSVKNYEVILRAISSLNNPNIFFHIIGEAITKEDFQYKKRLEYLINELKINHSVFFDGPISHKELPKVFSGANLFINSSETGSLDKSVLEAMAAGIIVVTSNEAFVPMLSRFDLIFIKNDHTDLSKKILQCINLPNSQIGIELRDIVAKNHNLEVLIPKLVDNL